MSQFVNALGAGVNNTISSPLGFSRGTGGVSDFVYGFGGGPGGNSQDSPSGSVLAAGGGMSPSRQGLPLLLGYMGGYWEFG